MTVRELLGKIRDVVGFVFFLTLLISGCLSLFFGYALSQTSFEGLVLIALASLVAQIP